MRCCDLEGIFECHSPHWQSGVRTAAGLSSIFFSIRLPLSASARNMFHLEFFDSEIQEVTNKVQYSGYQTCRNKRRFYSEQPQNLKTFMYENLVLRVAAFSPGVKEMGYKDVPPIILTRIFDNKVCEVQCVTYPVFPAGVPVLVG